MHAALAFVALVAVGVPVEAVDLPSTDAGPSIPLGTLDRAPRPALRRVTLAWVDVLGLSPGVSSAAAAEAVAVFHDIGLTLTVKPVAAGEASDVAEGLVVPVVLLAKPPSSLGRAPIMGLVLRDHASPSPIWVFSDNVRAAIGLHGPSQAMTALETRDFAVALGRVVAHEAIHALAPEHPHARSGLMASSIGRGGLVGSRQSLEASFRQSVLAGLASLDWRPRPAAAVGAAVGVIP